MFSRACTQYGRWTVPYERSTYFRNYYLVGVSVEPNEEDGFVMDTEDHDYDSDEDTVHIEVEDICRQRKRDTQERLDMV